MKNIIPITLNGEKILKKELNFLINIEMPKIIKEIYEARKYGDLKENSEYQSAIEQQILCENKIKEIENKLLNSIVIDITKIIPNNKVVFGSVIVIKNLNNNITNSYFIVGNEESNIKENKISISSPIARGFIGKNVGSIVDIYTPKGIIKYELLKIKYFNKN